MCYIYSMLSDKTDEEIINLYENGKEEVFKDLIDRYTSQLFNFAIYLTGKNNASDIVQETFIKVWKNIKKFNSSKASFKTWIFTIAKNTAMDYLRKKKDISFTEIEEKINDEDYSFSENVPDETLLPDEVLQRLQDSNLLNEMLNKLPINYKTILILHYQEDMTFDEIGKILDKPLNTVKSQHYRAIKGLREILN